MPSVDCESLTNTSGTRGWSVLSLTNIPGTKVRSVLLTWRIFHKQEGSVKFPGAYSIMLLHLDFESGGKVGRREGGGKIRD